ncbi:hypothetical protein MRB53_002543 [Persea americana]|uniref:Uncharacterized protein n=1 Tax=Persea americana TaxID=3435 RepID=A0ACC2MVR4_PERAE|nr:hypothetical protein MRB53_002543 [Persea americana]
MFTMKTKLELSASYSTKTLSLSACCSKLPPGRQLVLFCLFITI